MKTSTIIIAIILIAGAFFIFNKGITGNVINTGGDSIIIPLSEITETAKFYEYDVKVHSEDSSTLSIQKSQDKPQGLFDSQGTKIRFFAVKAKDGSIKTAFDACDVCFGSKKGYRQEGDNMICNNCGNKYPISGLGTKNLGGGGCWPGYLPNKIQGENLIIENSKLEEGKYRF